MFLLAKIIFFEIFFLIVVCYDYNVGSKTNVWTRFNLDLEQYPLALCLDGSPGAFWFFPGYGTGSDKYAIYFQGGGMPVYICLVKRRLTNHSIHITVFRRMVR